MMTQTELESSIILRPIRQMEGRIGGEHLSIHRHPGQSMTLNGPDWDITERKTALFQGQECPVVYSHRNWTGDDSRMTDITYFIQKEDCWYEIGYGQCGYGKKIPEQVLPGLETFQIDQPSKKDL